MSVYIDDYKASFGRMIMSHMMADTHEELLAMVDKIGVQRKWIQKEGTWQEHFDVCLAARMKAIRAGAVEQTPQQLVRRMWAKREPRP